MVSAWKRKKGKISKLVDPGNNHWNKIKEIKSMEWTDREEWRRKVNINLRTEICENMNDLYK